MRRSKHLELQYPLPWRSHAIYRLSPDLLLVFKPRGHEEAEHSHDHVQRLRLLLGELVVRTRGRSIRLRPASRAYQIAAGRAHSTMAVQDTWVIVESVRLAFQQRRTTQPRAGRRL